MAPAVDLEKPIPREIPSPISASRSASISSARASQSSHDDGPEKALTPQVSTASQPPLTKKTTSVGTTGTSDPNFEVDWDGDDDPENPRNWSLWRKSLVVATLSFSAWM